MSVDYEDVPFVDDVQYVAGEPWWHAVVIELLGNTVCRHSLFERWYGVRDHFLDVAPDGSKIREIEAQIGEWPTFDLDGITSHINDITSPPVISEAYFGLSEMMVCVAIITSVTTIAQLSDHEVRGLSEAWLDAATHVLAFVKATDEEIEKALEVSEWLRIRFHEAGVRSEITGHAESLFPELSVESLEKVEQQSGDIVMKVKVRWMEPSSQGGFSLNHKSKIIDAKGLSGFVTMLQRRGALKIKHEIVREK